MRPSDLNTAGVIDLSALRQPPATPGSAPATSGPGALVFDATEVDFEDTVLRRSLQVPVLVDFWAQWCGPCKQLSPLLERLAQEGGGAWALAKVDVDTNKQLAASVQIQSIPTILLALGGRLIQGFTGALPEQDLRSFLEQVLAAAQQAGLTGAGTARAPGEDQTPAGPPPEPEIVQAEQALEREDYAGAEEAYDALLLRRPGDPLARAGRASVALFRRTSAADPEQVLSRAASAPDDVQAQLDAADVEVIADRIEEAVVRLVALVRRTAEGEREVTRTHLIELFAALDPEDPRVIAGRRALASALF